MDYEKIVDGLDWGTSRWWAFPAFGVTLAVIWWVFGVDATNLYISIVTVGFFFLLASGQRKDRIANQLKHDAVIKAIDAADDGNIGLEKQTLEELEKRG